MARSNVLMKVVPTAILTLFLMLLVFGVSFEQINPDFDEQRFRSLKAGDNLPDVIGKIGNPDYGWKTGLSSNKLNINHALNPANGKVLSLEEIKFEMQEGVKIALFYSKSTKFIRLPFTEYKKYIVIFNGEHVSGIDEVIQD